MKAIVPQLLAFTTVSALTAACWMALRPSPAEPKASQPPPQAQARLESGDLDRMLLALDSATTENGKLEAALALRNLSPQDFPAVFERVEVTKDRQLTLAAKALLVHWASHDGEAAALWAWQRFREEGLWRSAFREIGAAWAWRDPAGLAAWLTAQIGTKAGRLTDATLDEVRLSDAPLFESDDLSRACRWLMAENPRLALDLLEKRGGTSSDDHLIWDALQDPRKIEDALLAFDDLDVLLKDTQPGQYFFGGKKGSASGLLMRWQSLDPEGFARSAYARYLPAPPSGDLTVALAEWRTSPPADPPSAATRLLESRPETARPTAVRRLTTLWAEFDPVACREWLDSLPPDLREPGAVPFTIACAAADLGPTMDWLDTLPPAIRHGCLVHAFDAWTAAHPGAEPDTSAWSEQRREAWADLQTLKSIGAP
jgi:hypothetical protein